MSSRPATLALLLLLVPLPSFAQSEADSVRRHYEAAEAERRAGNLAGAETEFEAMLGEAYDRLGRLSIAKGDYKTAVAALEGAAARRPDSPDVLVDLSIAYFHVDQYRKALEPIGKALARDPRSAAAHHMAGKTHFMLGEFPKAVEELTTALRFAPHDNDVEYTLGLAYLKQRDFARAKAVYDRMVVRLGDRAPLRVLIGRAYRETDFLAEAIAEFKKALALDPRFPRVHYYLGLTYLLKNGAASIPDARREFEVELAAHPDEFFANYYLGILAIIERRWEPAIGYLEKACRLEPNNPDPYFHLSQAYQGVAKHEQAIEALGKAISLNPDFAHNDYQVATAHYRLGQSLLKVGRTEEGEKELQIAADLKAQSFKGDRERTSTFLGVAGVGEQSGRPPDAVSSEGVTADPGAPDAPTAEAIEREVDYYTKLIAAAHNNIGLLRAERQDFRAAAEQFALAARWNPQHEGVSFNLGLANFKAERYAEAVRPLEDEVKARPENLAAKQLLGLSYFMTEDYPKASALLSEVIAARPGESTLYYPLSLSLAKQGRTEESNAVIQRMVAAGDTSPQLHVLLGQAYSVEGDTAKALEELRTAVSLDPKVPLAHFYMGMIQIKTGEFAEAVREFESELSSRPNDLQAKYHLGYALLAAQDTARGIQTMREVLAAKPDFADARYELGKALLQQGDVAGAVENLEAAAKLDPEAPHVRYQLGRAYIAAGRQADGERELELSRKLKERTRLQGTNR
jgi:tetratricopeptide (TPR) repeat protein